MFSLKEFLNLNFYISELDRFLKTFDKATNKLSASQLKEKNKYARIYQLRDKPSQPQIAEQSLWENF